MLTVGKASPASRGERKYCGGKQQLVALPPTEKVEAPRNKRVHSAHLSTELCGVAAAAAVRSYGATVWGTAENMSRGVTCHSLIVAV